MVGDAREVVVALKLSTRKGLSCEHWPKLVVSEKSVHSALGIAEVQPCNDTELRGRSDFSHKTLLFVRQQPEDNGYVAKEITRTPKDFQGRGGEQRYDATPACSTKIWSGCVRASRNE
jgi:hypothetical protein